MVCLQKRSQNCAMTSFAAEMFFFRALKFLEPFLLHGFCLGLSLSFKNQTPFKFSGCTGKHPVIFGDESTIDFVTFPKSWARPPDRRRLSPIDFFFQGVLLAVRFREEMNPI